MKYLILIDKNILFFYKIILSAYNIITLTSHTLTSVHVLIILKLINLYLVSKTTMSSIFYIFKDYNVFNLLQFQRLQCLLSFIFSKTTMFSVFYAFKMSSVFYAFRVFSIFCFMFYKTTMSSVWCFQDFNFLYFYAL